MLPGEFRLATERHNTGEPLLTRNHRVQAPAPFLHGAHEEDPWCRGNAHLRFSLAIAVTASITRLTCSGVIDG